MKKYLLNRHYLLIAILVAAAMVSGCNKDDQKFDAKSAVVSNNENLESDDQKVTYILGFHMASQASSNGVLLEKDVISMAIQDVLDGKEPRIPQEEQQHIMRELQIRRQAQFEEERVAEALNNKEKGDVYLAENARKAGVTTTASGLQYEVIVPVEGDADKPKYEDRVKVHYQGTLVDGTVFDSSKDRGQPFTFALAGVIPGWVEALQLMKVGERFKLVLPPNLAYSGNSVGSVGPNSVLIFDMELIEINPAL